jgi:phospholipid/cholesterol/gamma-HCH transport system ATP-binding protein
MVFQQPALFDSLNVYENVAYGLRRHLNLTEAEEKQRVLECLALVNLTGIESKMPQEISYGMQKRVSLARTIAVGPQILLFDEPTTGLDPITTNAINHLIKSLSRKLNTTSLVVSHDMQCALDIADRIVVLDKGYVACLGTPGEVRESTVPLVRDFMREVNLDA